MILTIYDLSGIQDYVFASNKLKEMIGASIIINSALFDNIPELFGEEADTWIKQDFFFNESDTAKTIYIGGGNALVMYKNDKIEKHMTRKLQELIFKQAGGALKLCSASIIADKDNTLSKNQKELMELLDNNKRTTPNVSTAKGFSINAHDSTSFEPIILFNDGYSTKSTYYKIKAYENRIKNMKSDYYKNAKAADMNYATNFDKIKKIDSKNFLAIIHIDGNTMGTKIRDFVKKQSGKLIEGLNALKKLSAEINEKYHSVLNETIKEVYKDKQGEIPFRPIIADGDDVTLICASVDAFLITQTFIQKLEESKLKSMSEINLTAGAGIAFVKVGFPFNTAYDIAEQCCKNAKKKTIERGDSGKSSIDFQICYGGITTQIDEFRQKNYIFKDDKNKTYTLQLRPYIFGATEKRYDYEKSFVEKQKEIIGSIARGKLKGLRNEYGKGVLQAKTYGDFILARVEKNKDLEIGEKLSKPFYEDGYAKFFDVLDALDIISEESSSEENN